MIASYWARSGASCLTIHPLHVGATYSQFSILPSSCFDHFPQSSHSPGPEDGRGGRSRSSSNTSLSSHFSLEEGNQLRYSAAYQSQAIPPYQTQGSHDADDVAVIHGGAASTTFSRLSGYTTSTSFGMPGQPLMPQTYQQLPVQTFPQFLHPPQDSQIGVQTQPMWTSSTWSTPQPQTQPLSSLGIGPQLVNVGQTNLNQPYPLIQVPSPQAQAVHTIDPSTAMPGFTSSTQHVPKSNSASPTSQSIKSAQDETCTRVDSGNVLPQNLRGDPFRSAKVKTEMCRDYNKPGGCRFGDKCNYAHGEHQLKNQKLMDLAAAGLVDIEVYRTHVCVPWVATGAW